VNTAEVKCTSAAYSQAALVNQAPWKQRVNLKKNHLDKNDYSIYISAGHELHSSPAYKPIGMQEFTILNVSNKAY
jgi:hypothetical protein